MFYQEHATIAYMSLRQGWKEVVFFFQDILQEPYACPRSKLPWPTPLLFPPYSCLSNHFSVTKVTASIYTSYKAKPH
jgi:hypothetical protein